MNYPSIRGYEITGVLGKGGMGTVYLARQLSLNRKVAVKILPDHLACNEAYVKRFHQEARGVAQIKHSGIVQVYDAGEDHGCCFFIMEYIDGETTGNRVRRKGRLTETNALLIAESVAVAMEYAWSQLKLVHRDVKPDNILIDSDGTVKVADLGLAKLVDRSDPSITMSRMLIGTPHYCAPEQAEGEPDVDCRADIYALGATLYHFLTGIRPFSETSGVAAMVKNVTGYLPDAMDCYPDISENVSWLIEKMMAKDKQLRHRDWHQVINDIGMVLDGKPPASDRIPAGLSTVMRCARRTGRQTTTSSELTPAQGKRPMIRHTGIVSSLRFRVFLIVAGLFTLVLYIVWFRMEPAHHSPETASGVKQFIR